MSIAVSNTPRRVARAIALILRNGTASTNDGNGERKHTKFCRWVCERADDESDDRGWRAEARAYLSDEEMTLHEAAIAVIVLRSRARGRRVVSAAAAAAAAAAASAARDAHLHEKLGLGQVEEAAALGRLLGEALAL